MIPRSLMRFEARREEATNTAVWLLLGGACMRVMMKGTMVMMMLVIMVMGMVLMLMVVHASECHDGDDGGAIIKLDGIGGSAVICFIVC